MIVRSDGSLVPADEEPSQPQTASNESAPTLATPAQDATPLAEPSGEAGPAPIAVETQQASVEQPAAATAGQPATATTEQPAAAEQPAEPAATEAAPEPAFAAPVPSSRPKLTAPTSVATAPTQPVETPATQTAAATPAPTQPQANSPAPAGGYYIQVASLPSEAEAQQSYRNLAARYASVIGGKGVDIKRVDINGKGTYYRVRIPAGDKDAAARMCESYRSAGGSCLIAR